MLFQYAALQPHYDAQADDIHSAYQRFAAYFRDKNIQQKILRSKEEQFQEGFLRELFVNVLDYTLHPAPEYNLITEKKNEDNAEKADGAIMLNGEVRGVIELKDTNTVDLRRVEQQAFGYKYHHRNATYVIISNFEKLRFYLDNALDYEEWNLFTLSEEQFKKLYLCLAYNNIAGNLPKQLKSESLCNEEDLTKRFYGDYSQFKRVLFQDLIDNNPQVDKLTLFKAAQKILDRIVFLCFAEDTGLIPPNTIYTITEEWKLFGELDEYRPLYQYFQKYFNYLDRGTRNNKPRKIFGYNGGLFRLDKTLDNLVITDEMFKNYSLHLCRYNFQSEVDVNILGHIFEHSISEIEAVKKKIVSGTDSPRQDGTDDTTEQTPAANISQSKRKADGIFYTPQYITGYLVETTLGKLCREKKVELGIALNCEVAEPEVPAKGKKKKAKNPVVDEQIEKLTAYQNWLLSVTVCDPACGSGAFLNASLDYFMQEHRYIDEAMHKLTGQFIQNADAKDILEKNLFGVDINDESVEITRLALWLHTAKREQRLNFLDNNIKVGNSLLSAEQADVPNAFDWQAGFPQVFARGGFDVIVSNPPYFNIQTLGHHSPYAEAVQKTYSDIWQDKSDILFYFIYKALQLSKSEVGLIVSNAFLFSAKAQKLRNHILQDDRLAKIVNFERFYVFPDANITTCLLTFNKTHSDRKACVMKHKKYDIDYLSEYIHDEANYFHVRFNHDDVFALVDDRIAGLNDKIDGEHPKLNTVCVVGKGMETAANEVFAFEKRPVKLEGAAPFIKKRMSGEMIHRYYYDKPIEEILYIEDCENYEDVPLHIRLYLEENKEVLNNRATVQYESRGWWRFSRPMHKECYHLHKIWCSYRSAHNEFVLDESSDFIGLTNTTVIFDTNEDVSLKYVLALLNSKLLDFRYKTIGKQTGGGIYEYFENGIGKLPIPVISKAKQKPFIKLVDQMIPLQQELGKKRNGNAEALPFQIKGTKITAVLRRMDELNFEQFTAEIERQGLTIPEHKIQMWRDLFEEECKPCRTLREQIAAVDKQLNRLVYELYALTADEIKIVEG